MSVTQKDIAKALNISQSLVAGVLGNRPDVWASAEKRKQIIEQARLMGYRANTAARRLRLGTSENVGLIILNPTDGSMVEYGDVVTLLASFLHDHGYDLNLKVFSDPEALLDSLNNMVSARSCDTFILCSPTKHIKRQAAMLEEMKASFVVLGSLGDRESMVPQINFDHDWLMRQCVDHLIKKGHKRIAFIGHGNNELYAVKLREGFAEAMSGAGLQDFAAAYIGLVDAAPDVETETIVTDWFLRPGDSRPTAIVMAANDDLGWPGLEIALARLRLTIGYQEGRIAVTGLHSSTRKLFFGEACAFRRILLVDLATALCEKLLLPVIQGNPPPESVHYVYPELEALPTMNMLDYLAYR